MPRPAFLVALVVLLPACGSAQEPSFTWGARNTEFSPAFPQQFRAGADR